eukprot:678231-Rhodomonas_salina.1
MLKSTSEASTIVVRSSAVNPSFQSLRNGSQKSSTICSANDDISDDVDGDGEDDGLLLGFFRRVTVSLVPLGLPRPRVLAAMMLASSLWALVLISRISPKISSSVHKGRVTFAHVRRFQISRM